MFSIAPNHQKQTSVPDLPKQKLKSRTESQLCLSTLALLPYSNPSSLDTPTPHTEKARHEHRKSQIPNIKIQKNRKPTLLHTVKQKSQHTDQTKLTDKLHKLKQKLKKSSDKNTKLKSKTKRLHDVCFKLTAASLENQLLQEELKTSGSLWVSITDSMRSLRSQLSTYATPTNST